MRPLTPHLCVILLAILATTLAVHAYSEDEWADSPETLTEALTKTSTPLEELAFEIEEESSTEYIRLVSEDRLPPLLTDAPTLDETETSFVMAGPLPGTEPAAIEDEAPSADEKLQPGKAVDGRVIQSGDKVVYRVIEDRDPPVTIPVLETGQIIIPYYGPVQAAGLTPSELQEKIGSLLTEELYQKASVVIAVQKPASTSLLGTVFLSGRVNRIGPMQIDPNQDNTISKLILTAGGFADFADSSSVQIIRKLPDTDETEVIEVDVKSIIEKGKLEKDVEVKDGDFIIVPQRLFNW